MIHLVSMNMEEVPHCFSRASVKCQGHMGWKIDLDIIWDYKASYSYQIPQICLVIDLDGSHLELEFNTTFDQNGGSTFSFSIWTEKSKTA